MKTALILPVAAVMLLIATLPARSQLAGAPDPLQSDALLLACPQGDATSVVFVRDAFGQPVGGVTVILDPQFAAGPWDFCEAPIAPPTAISEVDGGARFQLAFTGFAQNVNVLLDVGQGPQPFLSNQLIAGFDLDGNRIVDNMDFDAHQQLFFQNAPEADYNFDGQVEFLDQLLMQDHIAHSCDNITQVAFQTDALFGELDMSDTDIVASVGFAGTTPDTTGASLWLSLAFGPEDSVGRVELSLEYLTGGLDSMPSPLGDSGVWTIGLPDIETPRLGTWQLDDTFSIGPFDVVFYSTATDSILELSNPASLLPDSTDFVVRQGDTLQCVLEGTLTQENKGFSMMASLKALPGQQGLFQQLDSFDAPMLIGNYSPDGARARVRLVGNKKPCWELCVIPVIICNDQGQQCGLNLQNKG